MLLSVMQDLLPCHLTWMRCIALFLVLSCWLSGVALDCKSHRSLAHRDRRFINIHSLDNRWTANTKFSHRDNSRANRKRLTQTFDEQDVTTAGKYEVADPSA